MIILLSPAKTMDFSLLSSDIINAVNSAGRKNRPTFEKETDTIINLLKSYTIEELGALMKLRRAMAEKAYAEIASFGTPKAPVKPALFTYSGTVFQRIDAESLSWESIRYANEHVRIISGLYGILRPLDGISPYRLEMKTPVPIASENSLLAFWKKRIAPALLAEESLDTPQEPLINLASSEYMKAVDKKLLNRNVINFSFKEEHKGVLKTVGMYAKIARGIMVQRILKEKTTDPQELQTGETGGYQFSSKHSRPCDWIFLRRT